MGGRPVDLHLLDTHVWVWLVQGTPGGLKESAVESIRRAAARSAVGISAISVWEVAMLAAKGRIDLKMDCRDWVEMSIARAGIEVVPLLPEIAVESSRLPGDIHGDPSDRIIVATARHTNAVLVTRDRLLLAYGDRGHVRVLGA